MEDDDYKGFLDDTSLSKTPKSPLKTSTVAKENVNGRDDALRKKISSEALQSFFYPLDESSVSALNEVTNVPKSIKKPLFPLMSDTSFASEGANSSLGILHVENFSDLTDSTLRLSLDSRKKVRSKKKSKKILEFKGKDNTELKCIQNKQQNNSSSRTVVDHLSLNGLDIKDHSGSSSSSDIEYDGTNIPELNLDFNEFLCSEATKDETNEMPTVKPTETEKFQSFDKYSCGGNFELQLNATDVENSKLSHHSIFENFQLSYDDIFQQLIMGETSSVSNEVEAPQKIKVSPFLDISSFEIETVKNMDYPQKEFQNKKQLSEMPLEFCPEQISARSSSFRFSSKISDISSGVSCLDKNEQSNSSRDDVKKMSLNCESVKDEIVSGSFLKHMESIFESTEESYKSHEAEKDSGCCTKSDNTEETEERPDNKPSDNSSELHSGLHGEISGFATDGENWGSRLGISESEFFSSEAAKEMLRKDKEAFDSEHMFEIGKESKGSEYSDWSLPSQNEVTIPSWFSEFNASHIRNSGRHISIGTLIGARTENLGTLSEDSTRERPFFGTVVSTPIRTSPVSSFSLPEESHMHSEEASTLKVPCCENSVDENMQASLFSQLLNDISTTDPSRMASMIFEKCFPKSCILENEKMHVVNSESSAEKDLSNRLDFPNKKRAAFTSSIENSQDTLTQSSLNHSKKQLETGNNADIHKTSNSAEVTLCSSFDPMLNVTSAESANEEISTKSSKSDMCSNCRPFSQQNVPIISSRPQSSCSSTCSNPSTGQNALYAQYGCMKYFSSSQEQCHQKLVPTVNFLPHSGNFSHGCQHYCSCSHLNMLQPNSLHFGAQNLYQPIMQENIARPTHPLLQSGATISHFGIPGPSELCFPEKLSVGDCKQISLTVQNSHNLGFYHISYMSAYVNESPLPVELSGVRFSNIVPVSNSSATDIQILLAPKYEGKIKVELQIVHITNPVGQVFNASTGLSLKTEIQYEAVRPFISILSHGKETLDIGSIITGSTVVEYVTIYNCSEVAIPLKIYISNDINDNHVYFGRKEMERQKYPDSVGLKFLSPKVIQYYLPGSKNESLKSHLDIPIVFETGNCKGDVNYTITAAIETPTFSETLAFIRLSASVGNAKLVLKNPCQNTLTMRAKVGSSSTQSLRVVNQGTLSVIYDLQIEDDTESFTVSPASLHLQVSQVSAISITFAPLSPRAVKGCLQAAAQPHGKVFLVAEIFGEVLTNAQCVPQLNSFSRFSQPTIKVTKASHGNLGSAANLIECNKKYLAWGGVDIGDTVCKTFTIRNAANEALKAKLFFKGNFNGFEFLDVSNRKTNTLTFELNCNEEKCVSVVFSPYNIAPASGMLVIKPLIGNERKIFSIPLSGYGGISKVKVMGLPDREGLGYYLDINISKEAEVDHKNITLHNAGSRAAFVKLFASYDGLNQNPLEKQVVVQPAEFILLENEKRNVFVSLSWSDQINFLKSGVISIVYGDEVMRQRLRRKGGTGNSTSSDPLQNINFNVYYEGEDKVPYDSSYPCSPKDVSLFHATLKKLMIHVFIDGQNISYSRMSFDALSMVQDSLSNLTLSSASFSRRLTSPVMENHSPPVKDSATMKFNRLSLQSLLCPEEQPHCATSLENLYDKTLEGFKDMKLNTWIVKPQELILDADSKDNRILLVSRSKQDMRFKIECAVDLISVSPVCGILPAKGQIGLRITIISHTLGKLTEDYKGHIKILCDGSEKTVLVRVLRDQKKLKTLISPQNSYVSSNLSLRSEFLDDFSSVDSTVIDCSPGLIFVENIFNFPKHIKLKPTTVGVLSETTLNVQNAYISPVHWNIHPISILFSEPFEDSIENTDIVIQFPSSSGVLESMQKSEIKINFLPKNVGQFSQFFEINLNSDNGKQSCNVKIEGESHESLAAVTAGNEGRGDKNAKYYKKRGMPDIFVENDICEFPITAPSQKSTVDVVLKNISAQDIKLSVIKPNFPFTINHSSVKVKSRKFLKVHVHFTPVKPDPVYEAQLLFISEDGHEVKVKLKGCCTVLS